MQRDNQLGVGGPKLSPEYQVRGRCNIDESARSMGGSPSPSSLVVHLPLPLPLSLLLSLRSHTHLEFLSLTSNHPPRHSSF